jgi:Ca2+/Na+ antiporter
MIINIIRVLLLIILIVIIILDVKISRMFKYPNMQLLIALIILTIIIFVEESIGFLLGVIFLIIYFKYYRSIISNDNNHKEIIHNSKKSNIFPYISPELLDAAQNNVIDNNNYNEEILRKDIKNLYGIQGLDTQKNNFKGYDKSDHFSNYSTL